MQTYKTYINDRNYTTWEVFETNTFQKVDDHIDPNACKLFTNDVFSIIPFCIEDAESNGSNPPFIYTPERGILNEKWCKNNII